MGHLREFGGAFHELVISNVERVVVLDGRGEGVSWLGRIYSTPLPVRYRRNTFYLACRLVWAAGYFRALRPAPWYRRLHRRASARQAGRNAWLAFVRQFPDADEWERYLEAHRP
jgi:hypothetical protein